MERLFTCCTDWKSYYTALFETIDAGSPCRELTFTDSDHLGCKVFFTDQAVFSCMKGFPDIPVEDLIKMETLIKITNANRQRVTMGHYDFYTENLGKDLHLVLCGGGHVAGALLRIAKMIGYRVTVIDDRQYFCDQALASGADEVICAPFEEALRSIDDHSSPYYVIMTRGHQYDVSCMHVILSKNRSYLGMMGSKSRTVNLYKQLLEEGYDKETLDQIHMPIGLRIGAETPEEIAVSVIAEIIECQKNGAKMYSYTKQMRAFMAASDEPYILSTILTKTGSGPRNAGTKMIMRADGNQIGTIGGGYAEAVILEKSADLLNSGESLIQKVVMTEGQAAEDGLVCGGTMWVLIQPMK